MTIRHTHRRTEWVRAGGDLTRAVGVLSLGVAATMGFVAAALFALVLLGLTIPRVARVPPVLDLALGVALLFAAWSSLLDLYVTYPLLDLVVHAVATGLLAVAAYGALAGAGLVHQVTEGTLRHSRIGALLVVTAIGLGLAVLWELGEWYGHTYLDPRIQTGYDDTITDLATGGLGSLVAGMVLSRSSPTTGAS